MYLFMNALILALLVPAGGAHIEAGPSCRAELKGVNLLTVMELPNGVAVEGPWRVRDRSQQSARHYTVVATLDHVVEKDALTGDRSVIPFPEPVQLAFEGDSQEEVVRRAARVWCVTVMRAQENQSLDRMVEPTGARITALPRLAEAKVG
ncbi:MAG TPA: hypothetical protein VFZ69_12785 [Longimicrobiales bacterium]